MNKKGLELRMLGRILIGVVIIAILIISWQIITGKGLSALDFIGKIWGGR